MIKVNIIFLDNRTGACIHPDLQRRLEVFRRQPPVFPDLAQVCVLRVVKIRLRSTCVRDGVCRFADIVQRDRLA